MEIIGKIENGIVTKEYYGQGFIYKNPIAFENKTDEICYVPENEDDDDVNAVDFLGYKYSDFVRIVTEFVNKEQDRKNYLEKSGTTIEDLAKQLFYDVDWQCPETLIAEWDDAFMD